MALAAVAPFLALGGSIIGAVGQKAASDNAAAQSEQAAKVGKIQADQVDANYRTELNSTISNIRAIRSSAGVVPDSPTGMAINAKQTETSDRDRTIEVGNKRMQANQDENDARFRRSAGNFALLGGAATGLSKFFGS